MSVGERATRELSRNHLCWASREHSSTPWEYFADNHGDVYRAAGDSVIDLDTGYRAGARFECPARMWPSLRAQLTIS